LFFLCLFCFCFLSGIHARLSTGSCNEAVERLQSLRNSLGTWAERLRKGKQSERSGLHQALHPLPARNEWGEDSGEGKTNVNAPPLPNPLLHPMEEREKSVNLMQPCLIRPTIEAG